MADSHCFHVNQDKDSIILVDRNSESVKSEHKKTYKEKAKNSLIFFLIESGLLLNFLCFQFWGYDLIFNSKFTPIK